MNFNKTLKRAREIEIHIPFQASFGNFPSAKTILHS